jgi:hypothetical protein
VRFFVDDEASLDDPFAEDAYLRTVHLRALQELGFFLVPASRTWDRWISFSSEMFRRVVSTLGGMPAAALFRQLRHRLVATMCRQSYLCLETRRMIPVLSFHLLLLYQLQLSSQKTLKISSTLSNYRGPPLFLLV